jgi:hypothetical protein
MAGVRWPAWRSIRSHGGVHGIGVCCCRPFVSWEFVCIFTGCVCVVEWWVPILTEGGCLCFLPLVSWFRGWHWHCNQHMH